MTALEDPGGFVHSVAGEVDRLWSENQSGSAGLEEEDRATLAKTRELLAGIEVDSDEVLKGRVQETLGRIDELLGPSPNLVETSSIDVMDFLTAFREATPARSPDTTPKPVVAKPASPDPEPFQPHSTRWTPPDSATAVWTPPDPPPAASRQAVDYWSPPSRPVQALPSAGRSVPAPVPNTVSTAERPASRRQLVLRLAAAGVFIASVTTASLIAVHNNDAADKWRHLFGFQKQVSAQAARQVATANSNISTLNSEVKSLSGQVSGMQSQLSSVANQKEKAIDQTSVYASLLAAAGTVAENLQNCITATNQLYSDVQIAVGSGNTSTLPSLEADAQNVDTTCLQAQEGNQELQAAIQSAS